jgi:hypothetical protein
MEGIPFTAFCYYLNILIFALEKEKPDVGTSDDSDFDLIFVFKYHLGAPNCQAKWNKERAPPCNKIKSPQNYDILTKMLCFCLSFSVMKEKRNSTSSDVFTFRVFTLIFTISL